MVSYAMLGLFSVITGGLGLLLGSLLGFLLAQIKAQKNIQKAQEASSQQSPYNDTHIRQLFEGISSKILQQNSHSYLQQTDLQMKTLLSPLYKELTKLDQQMQKVEHNRTTAYEGMNQSVSYLNREIRNLYASNQALHTTTSKLNQALRSNHSTRGKWGEIQLRRIAEMTGMQKHIDFDEQIAGSSGGRPDMIIRMPQKGIIPVDAKAPMDAYLNAINAQSEGERKSFFEQHRRAVEKHIAALSDKAYWEQFPNAPQLVVLFLPYESGLEASVANAPDLLDRALRNKVIIAGPSTLYALLKVIAYGWMQTTLSENSKEIYAIIKTLFERFSIFYDHFSKIGTSLDTAVKKFNDASGSLSNRFIPTLKDINEKSESNKALDLPEAGYTIDSQPNVQSNAQPPPQNNAQSTVQSNAQPSPQSNAQANNQYSSNMESILSHHHT